MFIIVVSAVVKVVGATDGGSSGGRFGIDSGEPSLIRTGSGGGVTAEEESPAVAAQREDYRQYYNTALK